MARPQKVRAMNRHALGGCQIAEGPRHLYAHFGRGRSHLLSKRCRCVDMYEYIYICYDLCLSGHTECAVDHEQFERCLRALLVLRDAVASTECKGTGMKDIGHFHHFRDMFKLFMNRYFHVKNFKQPNLSRPFLWAPCLLRLVPE